MSLPIEASEALGRFGEYGAASQGIGRVAFVAALVATGVIERWQFKLRAQEAKTWWASNSRDVLNAAAFGVLWGAAALIGFSGPLCLLLAASLLVLLNTIQSALGEGKGGTRVSVALALVMGLPIALAPLTVDRLIHQAAGFLFR